MRTIDEPLARKTESSLRHRLMRDGRLLIRIGKMLFTYATVGRRIRRAYRDKEKRGEVYWVDEDLST